LGSQHGQKVSDRELNLFTERHKDKKIVLFFTTDFYSESDQNGVVMRDNMEDFVLNTKDKSLEYRKLHPPSYVYAWYARELCNSWFKKVIFRQTALTVKKQVPCKKGKAGARTPAVEKTHLEMFRTLKETELINPIILLFFRAAV